MEEMCYVLGSGCYICGEKASGDACCEPRDDDHGKYRVVNAPVCPIHGGPLAALPEPENSAEIIARIKGEIPPKSRYLEGLLYGPARPTYAEHGFSYGETFQGLREWGHAQRFLCDIPPSEGPHRKRRGFLARLFAKT